MTHNIWRFPALVAFGICFSFSLRADTGDGVRLQLNWLHDPTFVAEYYVAENKKLPRLTILQGGPNIFPLAEVKAGRADFAVVGSDVFLRAVASDLKESGASDLTAIYIDFQRNPVGWVLHPTAADQLGLDLSVSSAPQRLNDWLFHQIIESKLQVGDKRGTESTAIWLAWSKKRKLPKGISVVPVGFDPGVVLSAPKLIYPVYLNEEPYKLTEKIGKPVVVFDPEVDGVRAYGNVIIATKAFLAKNPVTVSALQASLTEAWKACRKMLQPCAELVARYYQGVPIAVVEKQVAKTIDFAFYETDTPGVMDLSEGGRWDQTLEQVQRSGVLAAPITLERLKEHLRAP